MLRIRFTVYVLPDIPNRGDKHYVSSIRYSSTRNVMHLSDEDVAAVDREPFCRLAREVDRVLGIRKHDDRECVITPWAIETTTGCCTA